MLPTDLVYIPSNVSIGRALEGGCHEPALGTGTTLDIGQRGVTWLGRGVVSAMAARAASSAAGGGGAGGGSMPVTSTYGSG